MKRYASLATAAVFLASALTPIAAQARFENDPSLLVPARVPDEAAADETAGDDTSASEDAAGAAAPRTGGVESLIIAFAGEHGVPVALARAVVTVESNFNPHVTGRAGEVGLMQIKPATARGIGYGGSVKALYDPSTNLRWGMKYLAGAYSRASGDVCGTIMRYQGGHYATRFTAANRAYCARVKRIMADA